jgi:hypothetical protein
MPDQDAVVAITSGVRDMQAVLNLVWGKLFPAMSHDALPTDDTANQKLKSKLTSLMMPAQSGTASAHIPQDASGKIFSFAANSQKVDSLGLEFGKNGDPTTLIAKFNGGAEQRIACGHGEWKKGRLAYGTLPEQSAAVSGAWTANDIYTAKICLYETPFVITATLDFSNDKLRYEPTWNVSFGPTKPGALVGERK